VSSSDLIYRRLALAVGVCLELLLLGACQYDVPITPAPTRNVDQRLLGDWLSADGKENMKVRRLDDSVYIVYYDGDLFRAYHSEIAETPFVTVQDLNANNRKYAYLVWKLSDDGKSLNLRSVSDKVIPKETKDSPAVVALLKKNARNAQLFGEEIEFRREK